MGVATGHQEVMQLGGNLPESLIKYTMLGHGDDNSDDPSEEDEDMKVGS